MRQRFTTRHSPVNHGSSEIGHPIYGLVVQARHFVERSGGSIDHLGLFLGGKRTELRRPYGSGKLGEMRDDDTQRPGAVI